MVTLRRRLFGVGLLCLATGCGAAGADSAGQGTRHRPAGDVVRLTATSLAGDDIGLVRDFDIAGDTIYLLDATGRVAIVERSPAGLRLAGHFSRQGAGPGELQRPTGLAMAEGSVAVMDGTRLQFFTRQGAFLGTKPVAFPCAMMRPSIAPAAGG
ncbi:MAG: hypothetical protein KFH98_07595, partial [Gemmatimonadetes bacterium]|nr:hypothetical protein [Gemmatimonadota bacterium]